MTNTDSKTIAIIMARGGSKGLPKKNTKPLNGKPLIAYSIEDAINSGVCDTVLVTSEDDEIIEISRLPIIKTRKLMGSNLPFDSPENLLEIANHLYAVKKTLIANNKIIKTGEILIDDDIDIEKEER